MNKLFTKIASLCVGLAMAVGVGVAVGSRDSGAREAKAATQIDISTASGTNVSQCEVQTAGGTNLDTVSTYGAVKLGKSGSGANFSVTVGANATKLIVYAAGWNGKSVTLTPSTTTTGISFSPASYSLTSNTGVANNSPFKLAGVTSTSDTSFKKEFTISGAGASSFTVKLTAASERCVVWNVSYETGSSQTYISSLTASLTATPSATSLTVTEDATIDTSIFTISGTKTPSGSVTSSDYEFKGSGKIVNNAFVVTSTSVYTYGDTKLCWESKYATSSTDSTKQQALFTIVVNQADPTYSLDSTFSVGIGATSKLSATVNKRVDKSLIVWSVEAGQGGDASNISIVPDTEDNSKVDITGAKVGTAVVVLTYNNDSAHAVRCTVTVQSIIEQTDRITIADFAGISSSSYSNFLLSKANGNQEITTTAVYCVEAKKTDASTDTFAIRQMNGNKDTFGGLVTTVSGGKIKSIKASLNGGSGSKVVHLFGKDTAYESEDDLQSDDKKGTEESDTISAPSGSSVVATHTYSSEYQYIGLIPNGATNFDYLEVTWLVDTSTVKPEISIGTPTALISTHQSSVDYTLVTTRLGSVEEDVTYTVSSNDTSVVTASENDGTLTLTPKGVGDTTVDITVVDSEDREGTLNLPVVVSDEYAYMQALSLNDIVVGSEYTFAGSYKADQVIHYCASNSTITGGAINKVEVTASGRGIIGATGVESYTLVPGSTSGKYAFWSSAASKYLSYSGTSLVLADSYSTACDATFVVSAGSIAVKYGDRFVRFGASEQFNISSTTLSNSGLYRNTSNKYTHFANALTWAGTFNTQAGALCEPEDGSGVVAGWDSMNCKSTYANLAKPVKDIIAHYTADENGDAIAQALARYDYATSTYTSLTKFIVDSANIQRSAKADIQPSRIIGSSETSIATVIVMVSVVSLAALGGYFFLRRRKEQ